MICFGKFQIVQFRVFLLRFQIKSETAPDPAELIFKRAAMFDSIIDSPASACGGGRWLCLFLTVYGPDAFKADMIDEVPGR